MLLTSNHFTPVIGIDLHFNTMPPFNPVHPFIGMVMDPMDYIPFIGATVYVNGVPRGISDTSGPIATFKHIPIATGPFAMMPMIADESLNFFGSANAYIEGRRISPKGYMVMTCNDVGIPASLQLGPPKKPGKKFSIIPSLFAPTSMSLPIPTGPPVMVGPPYVPDLAGLLVNLVAGLGFSAAFKAAAKVGKKLLKKANKVMKKVVGDNKVSKFLCKKGFEPVDLITGEVLYEGEDFTIVGGLPILWQRSYSSQDTFDGILGTGVHCNYDLRLLPNESEGYIGVTHPEGRGMTLPYVGMDEEYYDRKERLTLKRTIDGFIVNFIDSKLTYCFKPVNQFIEGLPLYKVSSINNIEGFTNTFSYNNAGYLTALTDAEGRVIQFKLDKTGHILEAKATHKGVEKALVSYEYDIAGRMTAIIDAEGQATIIKYDRNGRMCKKTDRNGQAFYWEYDQQNRCIHTWGDGGLLEGWIDYKEGYNLITNSKKETSVYYFNSDNLCTEIKDPLGHSQFFEYTPDSELFREINEEGEVLGFTYDDRGNRTAVVFPDGSEQQFIYNENDQLIINNDAEGNTTIYNYFEDGLTRSIVHPNKSATYFEYNECKQVACITDDLGDKIFFHYDEEHNLAQMELANGSKAYWAYDLWGQNTNSTNPEGKRQTFVYDELGRVTQIRQMDGNIVKLRYSAYDEVLEASDMNHQVKFEYTPLGNLKSREENGAKVFFKYNKEEELIYVRNEHNEFYEFVRNKRGDIIKESGFDGLVRFYDRNRAGRVLKVTRPENRWTTYEYDANGNIVRAEHFDGTWEAYSYNKNGRMTEALNQSNEVQLLRDEMGLVIEEIQDTHSIKRKYDRLGRRVHLQSSLGASLKLAYNAMGVVESMQGNNGQQEEAWLAKFNYNSVGQEIERILPGGISNKWTYDSSGMPKEHHVNGRLNKILRHRTYTWNANNRLQQMVNKLTNGHSSFNHDTIGNLAWAQYEDGSFDYKLPDEIGNLYKSKGKNDRNYGKGGQLQECQQFIYQYDGEGNLISKTDKETSKEWKYQWYGNGTLKQLIKPDGHLVSFEYDALGRRTAKVNQSASYFKPKTITRFVWDGNNPLHEWTYNLDDRPSIVANKLGELSLSHAEPIDQKELITWFFDELSFRPTVKFVGDQQYSIVCDYLGTPVEAYNDIGEKVWSMDLDIYGKVRKFEGDKFFIPFRFQGQYEDEETGLYYNRFRYYAPEMGTYISQDPIRLKSGEPNLYAYVRDTNLWTDAFGLSGILTIFSDSPKGDPIGHAFISVTENGKTTHIGQWPNPGFAKGDIGRILVSDMGGALDLDDTSHLKSSDLVSRSYDLNDDQMKDLKKFMKDFDAKNTGAKGYNLRNRQCASFAYGAARAAGIEDIKMPWYKWVTPNSLAKKIKSLNAKPACK